MKKLISVPGFIILSLSAAGFIALAFFIGTWTASSGKVAVEGAFVTVPASITTTTDYLEYKVSVPNTDANLAGVPVSFSTSSRYVSLNPASGTVMTDSNGLARIEVTTTPNAPTWARSVTVEASFSVGGLSVTSKTDPIPVKTG
jgi:hypothetical protein